MSPVARALAGAALASTALACAAPSAPGTASRPPDVVLVVLDTVRADHLGAWGYARPTSPNLDRLAGEAVRFDDAWAQAPWTLPSVASILTGQPPHVHGAGRGPEGLRAVRPDVPLLAERLAGAGYRTAAFVSVVFCGPRFGFARGFGRFDWVGSDETNRGQRTADAATDAALDWLDGVGDAPFFLVVHYFDPHLTYDPPAPWDDAFEPDAAADRVPPGFGSVDEIFALRSGGIRLSERRRESLVARYDGEIRFADEQLGRLRAGLEARGRWDGAVVVVVADHGEEFWEHGGFEHGHSHHREVLHVPLVVRWPGGPAGVVRDDRVGHLDVAPTVLAAAGVFYGDLPGIPLSQAAPGRTVTAEGSLWAGDLVSARSDEGSVLLRRDTGRIRWYAPDDPGEIRDLAADGRPAPAALEAWARGLPEAVEAPTVMPTPGEIETLRSLGYLD